MLPVIHDLNFEHYPADLPSNYSKWYRKRFPLFAQKGKRIVTVSEFSKQDIAKRYNVSAEKIDVVPNAAAEGFIPLNEPEQLEVRKKYCDGAPYFLYIGALHPRKNIERLISAFGWFKARNSSPVKLVIAGGSYWKTESISNALASVPNKEDVVFTGRVTEEEVRRLAASAFAMTYVPYFEGFGIPLVESMACGVPMITSNVTSMPEVAGDAALYCDPFSVESIGTAMQQLYNDPMLHEKLKKAGQDRISLYSWDNSAKLLWDCITKTLGT